MLLPHSSRPPGEPSADPGPSRRSVTTSAVFAIGLAIYLLAVAITYYFVGRRTHFEQFYLLDDTYIHLALAKNLVRTGTFGITPHVFSAIASSMLWPFLLTAVFAVSGVHLLTPFVMELFISALLLYTADRLFVQTESNRSVVLRIGLQLALIFGAPLLLLTFGGMEHVLQILVDLLFLCAAGRRLAGDKVRLVTYCLLAALATATRYEGLFLVLVGCLCLLWKRDWLYSITSGLSALLPVIGMGLFSMAHGSHFLPNSLLIKAAGRDQLHFRIALFGPRSQAILGWYAWHQGVAQIFVACLALLVLGLLVRGSLTTRLRWMLGVYVGAALLQSQFSRLGWIYRYEAYLLALGSFLIFCALAELWPKRREVRFAVLAMLLCGLALACVLPRAVIVNKRIPHHAEAIYSQQYQMGQFLARYYPGVPVVANDIGAIAFFGDHDILDLAGLGTVEVTNLLMQHQFTTDAIRQLAKQHNVQVAVAYPAWFVGPSQLPPEWTAVRSWNYDRSYWDAVGGIHVVFYAVQPEAASALQRNLREFGSHLPAPVTQTAGP